MAFKQHPTFPVGWFAKESASYILYSTAYRTPSFNELYYPNSTFSSGNSNRKPENSKTRDLELTGQYSYSKCSLPLLRNDIDDFIN